MNDSRLCQVNWPTDVNEQVFLDTCWQRKPLFVPNAFAEFETPLDANELAGLAVDPETTPRIIHYQGENHYSVENGPFEQNRFNSLDGNDWSLLVTDVEKHVPELLDYLQPFRFLPGWRIDDLMISYAPEGASVGAHVDEYDVFLLQASGTRRWLIDTQPDPDCSLVPDSELKLLAHFSPDATYELEPGDMLYLPPGVPHHGIATSDNCTTWSIGFRAPSQADILAGFTDMLVDKLERRRYSDGPLSIATPGEISTASISRIGEIWRQATNLSETELSNLAGRFLTQPPAVDNERFADDTDYDEQCSWRVHPFSRCAFSANDTGADTVVLFFDGNRINCPAALASELSTRQTVDAAHLPDDEKHVLKTLVESGCMQQVLPDDES